MRYAAKPQLRSCVEAVAAAIEPPQATPLSEWCDRHRRLSGESSVQPGRWTCFPYQREPLDCLSPHSPHQEVVLMWSAQMSKTELELSLVAFVIACEPGPVLWVAPTLHMAEALSKDRIAPMLRDTPALRGKAADPKSRDAGSTIYHRKFAGGQLAIVGSNSAAGLASRPIRFVILDEVDRFEASAGSEGDPAALAIARTKAFWNRKIVYAGTPTTRGASRIEEAFEESDQRRFHVPCPHCGAFQSFVWKRLEWAESRPETVAYRCDACEQLIEHSSKAAMVAAGRWVVGNPESSVPGFHLNELYSPLRSWSELAAEWLKAQGNVERLRVFINTVLGESWDDEGRGEATESALMARREVYGPEIPEKVALVTCGVDVQDDRLEASWFGWGRGEESWLIGHRVLHGDPSTPGLWQELDSCLLDKFRHPVLGDIPVRACCVDSGGHFTEQVTSFCDARWGRRIFAVKGRAGSYPVWPKRQTKAAKGKVYVIGVDSAKQVLYQHLKGSEDGPGRVHHPTTVGEEYFAELNSEYLRTTYRRGRPHREWARRKGRAAEALDCAVYAYAALCALVFFGVNLERECRRLETGKPENQGRAVRFRTHGSSFMGR